MPSAPLIASFSPDNNIIGDGLANKNKPTLSGTAVANSLVNLFDGTIFLGPVAANSNGFWSFATTALAHGNHNFVATDTVAGSTSPASSALGVTVDTQAPARPAISSFSPDSGTVGDGITDINQLTLIGAAEANSTVKVFDGASLLSTTKANAAGAWSFD